MIKLHGRRSITAEPEIQDRSLPLIWPYSRPSKCPLMFRKFENGRRRTALLTKKALRGNLLGRISTRPRAELRQWPVAVLQSYLKLRLRVVDLQETEESRWSESSSRGTSTEDWASETEESWTRPHWSSRTA